jgi:3-hydroxyacyl-CoA dehydrogenase
VNRVFLSAITIFHAAQVKEVFESARPMQKLITQLLILKSKNHGFYISMIEDLVRDGHLGAKTSRGFYEYRGRSEEAITAERDSRLIKVDEILKELKTRESI